MRTGAMLLVSGIIMSVKFANSIECDKVSGMLANGFVLITIATIARLYL